MSSSWSRCRLHRHAFRVAHACARCHLHVSIRHGSTTSLFHPKAGRLRGEAPPPWRHMVCKLSNDSITSKVHAVCRIVSTAFYGVWFWRRQLVQMNLVHEQDRKESLDMKAAAGCSAPPWMRVQVKLTRPASSTRK